MISVLLKDYENETSITRKFLERVPFDKLDWQPHPKSMKLRDLTVHTTGLAGWADMVLNTKGLDLTSPANKRAIVNTKEELLQVLDGARQKGIQAISSAKKQNFEERWIVRKGDVMLADMNKYEAIRHSLRHTAHHRAQLGVYFRLLDIPVPGAFGPSADE